MSTVAERILQIVEKNGGNMSAFARRINVTPAYISKLKNDSTRVPSDRILADICREFNVNENWLRHGIGNMEADTSQLQKLTRFFADVLASCPDERSAFVAALNDLPTEYWPLVTELVKNYVDNLKKEEAGP